MAVVWTINCLQILNDPSRVRWCKLVTPALSELKANSSEGPFLSGISQELLEVPPWSEWINGLLLLMFEQIMVLPTYRKSTYRRASVTPEETLPILFLLFHLLEVFIPLTNIIRCDLPIVQRKTSLYSPKVFVILKRIFSCGWKEPLNMIQYWQRASFRDLVFLQVALFAFIFC